MSRWFRHYAGMMRDEKLVRVAVKAGQPVERVIWVWGAILESACEVNDGGRYDFDADEAAYFLRCESSDVGSILAGLEGSGRICEGMVTKWRDRQFDSDTSRERQRRYRERRDNDAAFREGDDHNACGDGDVTSRDGGVTLQEDREQITEKENSPSPVAQALEAWNETAKRCGLAEVKKFTDARRRKLAARLKSDGLDGWSSVLARVEASSFLRGENDRGWRADIDFVLSETNFAKILEGKYDRRQTGPPKTERRDQYGQLII